MHGSKVWAHYQAGELSEIRNYCETDVLNTYLVYLRFEHMRGTLDDKDLERELTLVRDTLKEMNQPHLKEFEAAWASG